MNIKEQFIQNKSKFIYEIRDKVIFNDTLHKITGQSFDSRGIRYAIDIPNEEYNCIYSEIDLKPYTENFK